MNSRTFNQFRSLIYERSGISLGEGKETLVSARIAKRMRVLGLGSHQEYYAYALDHEADGELVHLLNAVSTNYTSFFREPDHFELLERLAREWVGAGQRRLRVWSAACSTGEEPYTIAMVLQKAIENRGVDAKILATDISTKVLEKACAGVYTKDQFRAVPAGVREKSFEKVVEGETPGYRVSPQLKEMISFRRFNLSTPPFPMSGPMDVVFCRNVMIYFDNSVRTRLLNEIHRLLKPGGYLMVGHAESLTGLETPFRALRPSVYIK